MPDMIALAPANKAYKMAYKMRRDRLIHLVLGSILISQSLLQVVTSEHHGKIVKRFAIASVLNPSAVAGNNGVRLFPGPRRALIGNVARYASAASSLIPIRSGSYATRRSSSSSSDYESQHDPNKQYADTTDSIRRSYQSEANDNSYQMSYNQQQQQSYQKPKTLDSYERPATLSPLLLSQSNSNNNNINQQQHLQLRQQQQQYSATTRQPQYQSDSYHSQQSQKPSTTRLGYDQIPAPKSTGLDLGPALAATDYSSGSGGNNGGTGRLSLANLSYNQRNHGISGNSEPASNVDDEPTSSYEESDQQSPKISPKRLLEPSNTNQFERRSLVPSYNQQANVPTIYGRSNYHQDDMPLVSSASQSDYPPAPPSLSSHHHHSQSNSLSASPSRGSRYNQQLSYQKDQTNDNGYNDKAQESQSNQSPSNGPENADENAEQSEASNNKPDKLALLMENSKFQCTGRKDGYYADNSVQCQAFHYCVSGAKHSWMCPEGTVFHQVHLNCVPASQDICDQSEKYHVVNDYLYKPMDSNGPNATVRYHQRYYPEEFTYGMPTGTSSASDSSGSQYNSDNNQDIDQPQQSQIYRPIPAAYPKQQQRSQQQLNYAPRQSPDQGQSPYLRQPTSTYPVKYGSQSHYAGSNSENYGSSNNQDPSSNLDDTSLGITNYNDQNQYSGGQNDPASSSTYLSTATDSDNNNPTNLDADITNIQPHDSTYSTRSSSMPLSSPLHQHQHQHHLSYNQDQYGQHSSYSPQSARLQQTAATIVQPSQLASQRQRLATLYNNNLGAGSRIAAMNGIPVYGSPSIISSSPVASYNGHNRRHQIASSPYENSVLNSMTSAATNNNYQIQSPPQNHRKETTAPVASSTPKVSNHIDSEKLATLRELASRLIPHMTSQSLASALASTKKSHHNENNQQLSSIINQQDNINQQPTVASTSSSAETSMESSIASIPSSLSTNQSNQKNKD